MHVTQHCATGRHDECEQYVDPYWCECDCHHEHESEDTMDPDTTLANALALARAVADGPCDAADADDLAQALLSLDEWLAKGGYLPARWRPGSDDAALARMQLDAQRNSAELRRETGR